MIVIISAKNYNEEKESLSTCNEWKNKLKYERSNTMLVIFDMDGLMFDTERLYHKGWIEAAKLHGYDMTWEMYTKIVARNTRYIKEVLKKELNDEALPFESLYAKKGELCDAMIAEEGLLKKEGLVELLEFLEEQGIPKVIATSSMRERATHYLELSGLTGRFDGMICGSELEESKPNPEIFLKAAKLVGAKPEECLVLEDSRLGLQAAKAAHMKSVLIPDLIQPDIEMKENATYILPSLRDVISIIKELS